MSAEEENHSLSTSGKSRVKVRTRKSSATPRQLDAAQHLSTELADLPIERSRSETESWTVAGVRSGKVRIFECATDASMQGAAAARADDEEASLDESSSIAESESDEGDERQRRAAARSFVDRVIQRALAVELVRGVMQRAQASVQ